MPEIELSDYYVDLIGWLLTLLLGLAIKDWATSLVKGINFKYNSSLKEGDKVILEDLIVAAHNKAKAELKLKTTEEISKTTGGLNIPGFKWPL